MKAFSIVDKNNNIQLSSIGGSYENVIEDWCEFILIEDANIENWQYWQNEGFECLPINIEIIKPN